MPLFRAEVKWTDVAVIGGTFTASAGDSVQAGIYFQAREIGVTNYNMHLGIQWNSFGAGPTFEHQTFCQPLYNHSDVWGGTAITLLEEADGENGAIYKAGGTLAIEKDTVAETVTWITPLGDVVQTYDDLEAIGPRPTNAPLLAWGMGHRFNRSGADGDSEKVRWLDFYAYQDDEIIQGAALTIADPGIWTAWLGDTAFGGSGTICVDENTQLANGYQTKYRFNTVDEPPTRKFGNRAARFWDQLETATGIDLVAGPEIVRLFRVGARPYQPQRLTAWTSYDGGRVWSATVLYEAAGEVFTSPSLTWRDGRLMAVWKNATNDLFQATSWTGGLEWEMPITLPYTGTFPRHIVNPRTGLYLYFFFDGTTLKVARSSDFGHTFWDASPITITGGLTAQQIDAEVAFDESIIVTYFNGGAWEQMRSWDGGLSWS